MNDITWSSRHTRRVVNLVIVGLIVVGIWCLLGPGKYSRADSEVRSTFVPLPASELQQLNQAAQSAVNKSPVRTRAVIEIHHAKVDPGLFASFSAKSIKVGTPASFQVSPSVSVTVVTDQLEQGPSGTVKWHGHVPGDPNSSFHLIVSEKDRSLFGDIRIRGRLYEIRPTGSGAHTIYTIDPSRLPPDHAPARRAQPSGRLEKSPLPAAPNDLRSVADSGGNRPVELERPHAPEGMRAKGVDRVLVAGQPEIDVMVLYTRAASMQAIKIGDQVCQAKDQMTRALVNSGVQAKVRLVHAGEFDYDEQKYMGSRLSNIEQILADIKAPGSITALRDLHGADVVSFWVSDNVGAGQECGLSLTLDPPNMNNANAAYSVVLRSCATASLSFAHELGHLLGAHHDRFADKAGLSTEHNWGYVRADRGWRTIMAYDRNDCQMGFCDRLEYWSNPLVSHPASNGVPTGRPTNTPPVDCNSIDYPGNCDGPAYNKLTLDGAASIVANFRQPGAMGNIPPCANSSGGGDAATPLPPSDLRVQ